MKIMTKLLTVAVLLTSTSAFAESVVICSEAMTFFGATKDMNRELKNAESNGYSVVSAPSVMRANGLLTLCVTASKPVRP